MDPLRKMLDMYFASKEEQVMPAPSRNCYLDCLID